MDWRYNTIWFEQLEQGDFFTKDFKENSISTDNKDFGSAKYAILWYLKRKLGSFDNLSDSDILLYLELNWANIIDFTGIGKFNNLKRLELHSCVKLESDNGLSQLGDSIEFLHINQSKKFKFDHELCELKKLKVLRLNSCGPIESLDFLSRLPNLVDFRFVNTNVLDGNLNPILEHPTIRSVGFFNKRHYNLKEDKLTLELGNKFSEEHKTFAYKGDYSTFRIDYGDNNS